MENQLVIGRITRGTPGSPGFKVLKEDTCDSCGNVLEFLDQMFGHDCEESNGTI